MPYPWTSEIHLPPDARSYSFVDTSRAFNSNYDIIWSFQYKLPASSLSGSKWPMNQLGFTTFLTTLTSPTSSLPGQYLGDSDPIVLSASDVSDILTEGLDTADTQLVVDSTTLSGTLVKIAFDTTGFYALCGRNNRQGVLMPETNPQSFIVRDFRNEVVSNTPLTAMAPTFSLSTDTYNTLRFRYVNMGRTLHVDFRDSTTTTYSPLTTLKLGYRLANFSDLGNLYVGFSFCTPVCGDGNVDAPWAGYSQLSSGPFFLKDFTAEGFVGSTVTTETLTSAELSAGFAANPNTSYTTVTNITVE